METETPTPTYTPVPEITVDLYIESTTPGGYDARIERSMTAGEGAIIVMLALLLASIWVLYLASLLRERRRG